MALTYLKFRDFGWNSRLAGWWRLTVLMLGCLSWTVAAGAAATTTQVDGASAVSVKVLPDGTMSIFVGTRRVGDGLWTLQADANQPVAGDELPLVQKSIAAEQDSPAHAKVTQQFNAAVAEYEIALNGEDLRLRLHLQNQDTAKTIKHVNLAGPTFRFAHAAEGTLASWHSTYLSSQGLAVYHPSTPQPVGFVYARDENFGVGMYSSSEFDRQSLFNAGFMQNGIIPADSLIQLYTTRQVPPGQSVDVEVNFRISSDSSMKHLIGAYKTCYDAHFPKLFYHPDTRPLAAFTGIGEANAVTRANPYGFIGAIRRLDSAAGTNAYVRLVGGALQRVHALGIIFWSPGGYRPPMYPPDFDVFPDAVQQHIPTLVDGFRRRGLRVGLCARCGDGVIREAGKDPVLYRLAADNPKDMQTLLSRFNNVLDLGFDVFYLDSFGSNGLNDLAILKKIRESVGPDVLFYTEFGSDMSMPYAGRYCEWQGQGVLWTTPMQYEELKYLSPDSTWLCISKKGAPVPREFGKWGLVPLVDDMQSNHLPMSQIAR
jgi:hypothetical protein